MSDDNVWLRELPPSDDQPWLNGTRAVRVGRGEILGATLHELPPRGRGGPLHFHHGNEEMLVVLRGRPTLRTNSGERQLEEGEVVVFRRGPDDAHKCSNDTAEPVRYLVISNNASPDAVEYPEDGLLSVMAYTRDQFGKPLWDMRKVEPPKNGAT
jgi:uncharacterized cupin superfamily protein